jgi:hypothetical protein
LLEESRPDQRLNIERQASLQAQWAERQAGVGRGLRARQLRIGTDMGFEIGPLALRRLDLFEQLANAAQADPGGRRPIDGVSCTSLSMSRHREAACVAHARTSARLPLE